MHTPIRKQAEPSDCCSLALHWKEIHQYINMEEVVIWWILGGAGALIILVAALGWLGYRLWWTLEHSLGANRREDLW